MYPLTGKQEYVQLHIGIKIVRSFEMFSDENHFFFIICSFNPNRDYWSKWRLFAGNLLGILKISSVVFKLVSVVSLDLVRLR